MPATTLGTVNAERRKAATFTTSGLGTGAAIRSPHSTRRCDFTAALLWFYADDWQGGEPPRRPPREQSVLIGTVLTLTRLVLLRRSRHTTGTVTFQDVTSALGRHAERRTATFTTSGLTEERIRHRSLQRDATSPSALSQAPYANGEQGGYSTAVPASSNIHHSWVRCEFHHTPPPRLRLSDEHPIWNGPTFQDAPLR